MARRRISEGDGLAAVKAVAGGDEGRATVATAVRFLLEELAERAPGRTLEVRVPPYGAVQCVDGPRHTRGTPPNVVELDAETWVGLALGKLDWPEALADHRVSASGTRASLQGLVPLIRPSWIGLSDRA